MTDKLIKSLWPFPDWVWEWIFKNGGDAQQVAFKKPSYEGIRVSANYMLVKVPKESKKGKGWPENASAAWSEDSMRGYDICGEVSLEGHRHCKLQSGHKGPHAFA